MLSPEIIDARKRCMIAADIRLMSLSIESCRHEGASGDARPNRQGASTDRFRLLISLTANIVRHQILAPEIVGRFLVSGCLKLLEQGLLPAKPVKFLQWFGAIQGLQKGRESPVFENLWFDDDFEDCAWAYHWCSPDELIRAMEELGDTRNKSALEIYEWLAKRPDLTACIVRDTPLSFLADDPDEWDVRQMLPSEVLRIIRSAHTKKRAERARSPAWQNVVMAVNVAFLTDLIDLCLNDGIDPLGTALGDARALLSQIQTTVAPHVLQQLSARLDAAASLPRPRGQVNEA